MPSNRETMHSIPPFPFPGDTIWNRSLVLLSLLILTSAQTTEASLEETDEDGVPLVVYIIVPVLGSILFALLAWRVYWRRRRRRREHQAMASISPQPQMVQLSRPNANNLTTSVVISVHHQPAPIHPSIPPPPPAQLPMLPQHHRPLSMAGHREQQQQQQQQQLQSSRPRQADGEWMIDDQTEALANPVPPYSLYPELRTSTLSPAPLVAMTPLALGVNAAASSHAAPAQTGTTASYATTKTIATPIMATATAVQLSLPQQQPLSPSAHSHASITPTPTATLMSSSNRISAISQTSSIAPIASSLEHHTSSTSTFVSPPPATAATVESLYPPISAVLPTTVSPAASQTSLLYPSLTVIEPATMNHSTQHSPPLSHGLSSSSLYPPISTTPSTSSLYPTLAYPPETSVADHTSIDYMRLYPSTTSSTDPNCRSYGGGMVPSLQPAPDVRSLQ